MPSFIVGIAHPYSSFAGEFEPKTRKLELLDIVSTQYGAVDAIEQVAQYQGEHFAIEVDVYPTAFRVNEAGEKTLEVDVP